MGKLQNCNLSPQAYPYQHDTGLHLHAGSGHFRHLVVQLPRCGVVTSERQAVALGAGLMRTRLRFRCCRRHNRS